jgi:F-type H+-transporting ATPase subunit epsilon
MNNFFKLKIVAANTIVLDRNVNMVIVPSSEGFMAVLKGHVDMLSLINLGVLEVKIDNNAFEKYVVHNGICRIKNGVCEIVVRELIKVAEIDKNSLITSISDIQSMINNSLYEDKKIKLQQKLEYLNLCLKNYMER